MGSISKVGVRQRAKKSDPFHELSPDFLTWNQLFQADILAYDWVANITMTENVECY